jgi:phosphoenolpyruvate-protein kinase (PTS system EI component)
MLRIGGGMLTCGGACRGTLRRVSGVADVLRLMQTDLSGVILLTNAASATFVTPLFPLIRGIVCTTGGATSHIAIVAREFNLACVMAAGIDHDGELEGRMVGFTEDGTLYLEPEP